MYFRAKILEGVTEIETEQDGEREEGKGLKSGGSRVILRCLPVSGQRWLLSTQS